MAYVRDIFAVALAVAISILALVVGLRGSSPKEGATCALLLLFSCWIMLLNHRDEILKFRRPFLVTYTLLGCLGVFASLCLEGNPRYIIVLVVVSGLGMSLFLLPGVTRLLAYACGLLRRSEKAGKCEGISLMFTHAPLQMSEFADAVRYSLSNRPFVTKLRSILRGQIVIAPVVGVVRLMHRLACATLVRRFNVLSYVPRVPLSWVELSVYTLVFGVLAWLALGIC